jgi:hypothetical protein
MAPVPPKRFEDGSQLNIPWTEVRGHRELIFIKHTVISRQDENEFLLTQA